MDERQRLLGLLEQAQDRGLIGPGAVGDHVEHARAWATALGDPPPAFLDLGSGGGVPGLVLAAAWPSARAVLLDARTRSVTWITSAVDELGWGARVSVVAGRAEEAGRDPARREAFPLVVARGFGAPAVTAECGSAFVAVGGRLSVSEPPGGDPDRWPEDGLATLGLEVAEHRVAGSGSFVVLVKVAALGEWWPRRVGVPERRPLW